MPLWTDDIQTVAWITKNSKRQSHAVGEKQPNELGIYDMSGNVWEFCSDWYRGYPNSNDVPDLVNDGYVIRGGAWGNSAKFCTAFRRYPFHSKESRNAGLGFRLAL